jgi:hypothetical protein
LIPEFQTAYTLDGRRIPKFADYLNVMDPRDDADLNPQWVNMQQEVDTADSHSFWNQDPLWQPKQVQQGGVFELSDFVKYAVGL